PAKPLRRIANTWPSPRLNQRSAPGKTYGLWCRPGLWSRPSQRPVHRRTAVYTERTSISASTAACTGTGIGITETAFHAGETTEMARFVLNVGEGGNPRLLNGEA